MSSPKQPPGNRSPPKIRIQSASPETASDQQQSPTPGEDKEAAELTPRRAKSLPSGTPRAEHQRHRRKRSATTAHLVAQQEADQKMAGSSRSGSDSSRKHSSSSSKKSKSSSKDLDWTDVTDPEERRRIQNRIAQRKFREKARENREKSERDSRNQEYAGNSYRIPSANDFTQDSEPSGLPWGSVNVRHVISRGHEAESRRSSGRGTYVGDDGFTSPQPQYSDPYGYQWAQPASYGGSSGGGDEVYYDDAYYYDPNAQGR